MLFILIMLRTQGVVASDLNYLKLKVYSIKKFIHFRLIVEVIENIISALQLQ